MRFTKLGLALFTILASSPVMATMRDNFYLGAGAGVAVDYWSLTVTDTSTGTNQITHSTGNNIIGNVFAGYGYTACNHFYLGGELGSNFPKRNTSLTRAGIISTSNSFIDHLFVQDYVTADVLPGYRFNDKLLAYGRVGATYSHLSFLQGSNSTAGSDSFSSSSNKVGGRLGVGANCSLTKHLGAGLDYFYTYYPSVTSDWGQQNLQFKEKPHTSYLGLSVIYSFL